MVFRKKGSTVNHLFRVVLNSVTHISHVHKTFLQNLKADEKIIIFENNLKISFYGSMFISFLGLYTVH